LQSTKREGVPIVALNEIEIPLDGILDIFRVPNVVANDENEEEKLLVCQEKLRIVGSRIMVVRNAFDNPCKQDSGLFEMFLGNEPDWIGDTAQASEQFERDVQNFCQRTELLMKVAANDDLLMHSAGQSNTGTLG
jgi:hypothetical protein